MPLSPTGVSVQPVRRFVKTPVEHMQPPVTCGEHHEEVYRSIFCYSEAEIAQFRAHGHRATELDSRAR